MPILFIISPKVIKMTEKKDFPFNLHNKDLLALYNILYLAKGATAQKTIKQVFAEVRKELEIRLQNEEKEGF